MVKIQLSIRFGLAFRFTLCPQLRPEASLQARSAKTSFMQSKHWPNRSPSGGCGPFCDLPGKKMRGERERSGGPPALKLADTVLHNNEDRQ